MWHRPLVRMLIATAVLTWSALTAYADYHATSQAAGAGAAVEQLNTAITHAGFAAGASAVSGATTHLGHALNCIEGAKGKNFNAAWGHVCQGQGDGILVDVRGAKNAAAVVLVLQTADDLAVAGVKSKEVGAIQNAARGVAALLQVVLDGIK